MTSRISTSLSQDPSARVRAAVMVDRWVFRHFEETFELGDGELFERALLLQLEVDRIEPRKYFDLQFRLVSSPFQRVRRAARQKVLGYP